MFKCAIVYTWLGLPDIYKNQQKNQYFMKDSGEIDPSWKEHDWNKTDH